MFVKHSMKPESVVVTIIIPSYNSHEHIGTSLDALHAQVTEFGYEVLVVDCSDTTQVSDICSQYPFVKLLRESERFLPGKGRNIGADAATGKLLLFVDADVILSPTAIDAAMRFYLQGNNAFGGSLELNESKAKGISPYVEHYFFNHESHKTRPESQRANLSSALMAIDRSLFLKHGGFKNIPRMQDTELTERLARSEEKLAFTPSVVGLQLHDSPMSKVLKKIFINGNNLYYIRYQGKSKTRQWVIFILLPAIATFKILRILGRHMRYQTTQQRIKTLLVSPFLIAGAAYWLAGLYKAYFTRQGIATSRE